MRLLTRILLFAIVAIVPTLTLADPPPYQDICEVDTNYLCDSKGKQAFVKSDKDKTKLGKIVALVWVDRGEPISIEPTVESCKNGYYYVIAPTGQKSDQFLVDTIIVETK
jgi:hypothetical protein